VVVNESRGQRDAPGRGVAFPVHTELTTLRRAEIWLATSAVRAWWHPVFVGTENVPAEGPVIIAPVHRSFADFAFGGMVTNRKVFYMAKDTLWRSRLLGGLLVHAGAFPVHRETTDREAMRHAEEVLARGQVLLMFPEGTRQVGPQVQDLHDGVAFVAARTGARIVPVGIAGSDVSMPKGRKVPRRTPIKVVAGPPLLPPPRADGRRLSRSRIRATTAELAQAIQKAYDEART
jgi:1-acyl-sn-glycerol-3-phosphate acyltransferase